MILSRYFLGKLRLKYKPRLFHLRSSKEDKKLNFVKIYSKLKYDGNRSSRSKTIRKLKTKFSSRPCAILPPSNRPDSKKLPKIILFNKQLFKSNETYLNYFCCSELNVMGRDFSSARTAHQPEFHFTESFELIPPQRGGGANQPSLGYHSKDFSN